MTGMAGRLPISSIKMVKHARIASGEGAMTIEERRYMGKVRVLLLQDTVVCGTDLP